MAEPDDGLPTSRDELWELIRQSGGKESFTLSEMIRLGFWDSTKPAPKLAEAFIARQAELRKTLDALTAEHSRYASREKLLADIHKKRKAEAKQRRKENKERRERERLERAERWRQVKASDIPYLGEGVSAGLSNGETHAGRIRELGLPVLDTVGDLAEAMKLRVGRLRFLAFHRRVSKITHYRRFFMQKKTGGLRLISAPMPQLKYVQNWVLDNILSRVALHDAAHGFVQGRSICSNALPHTGADVVVNMDLKDFFPTISYPRVKGMFRSLGYSEKMATLLALICTEPDVEETELDGETFYLQTGERYVPQGAPTSPAVTNIICRRMDARMHGIAGKLGIRYTRYADDLTFSGGEALTANLQKLLWRTRAVIADEGFTLHPGKLRIMRKGSRQEVTGVVVNEKLNVDRATFKRFRALLHQIEKDGPDGKHWNQAPNLFAAIHGYASFVFMVNPEKGAPLLKQTRRILKKHGWKQKVRYPAKGYTMPDHRPEPPAAAAEDPALSSFPQVDVLQKPGQQPEAEKKKKPWWKFWG